MPLRLDHIGIVVRDLEKTAVALEQTLGLKLERMENYRDSLRIGFFPLGEIQVELIEPLSKKGMNAEFLQQRGEGVHHLAFAVKDLSKALKQAQAEGARMLLQPCIGAEGKPIAFLEGTGLGGTALELVEQGEGD